MFSWKYTPLGAFIMFTALSVFVAACYLAVTFLPNVVIIILGIAAAITFIALPMAEDIGRAIKGDK